MRKFLNGKTAGVIVTAALSAAFMFMSTSTASASTQTVQQLQEIIDPNLESRPNETLVVAEDGMIEHYCDVADLDMEGMEVIEDSVTESSLYTSGVNYHFDWTVNPDTRHVTGEHKVSKGMTLGVSAMTNPFEKYYWLGIMDDDGHARYVSGHGAQAHNFAIKETNIYRVFVQNNYKDGKTKLYAIGNFVYE